MRKKKNPPPPAPDCKSFQNQTEFRIMERRIKRRIEKCLLYDFQKFCNVQPIEIFGTKKDAFLFPEFPGLVWIPDAIPSNEQNELIELCFRDLAKSPNVSNLDSHFHLPKDGIWNIFSKWRIGNDENAEPKVKRRFFPDSKESIIKSAYDDEMGIIIDSPVDRMSNENDMPVSKVLKRLRWLTLGHQYDWSKKEYHFDRVPPFPLPIVILSQHIVKATQDFTGYDHLKWNPEAGIVNFYQPGDSLTAHQDKSELNMEAPLISISLGLECIFLLGTNDRNDKPIALSLKSGDVLIISKDSRKSFHGVPKVIENTLPPHLDRGNIFSEQMTHTRININIRQVF